MSNFIFIKADFPDLFTDAVEAEQLIFVSPKSVSSFNAQCLRKISQLVI